MVACPNPSYRGNIDSYPSIYYLGTTTFNAIVNPQVIKWRHRSPARAKHYDRSFASCYTASLGVFLTILFSIGCIYAGVIIYLAKSAIIAGVVVISLQHSWQRELVCLTFSLLVTGYTEATGYMHAISLRTALSSEDRLHFNTNLRLFSAARGLLSPNGMLLNIIMAILLIISYSSSILVTLAVHRAGVVDFNFPMALSTGSGSAQSDVAICISSVPLVVLGASLMLQALIALSGMVATDILTWSSSPFDITNALVFHKRVTPKSGRCMRDVRKHELDGPCTPQSKQPSAWAAHFAVRRVVRLLWLLVLFNLTWGIVTVYIIANNMTTARTPSPWSFFTQTNSLVIAYEIPHPNGTAWSYWVLYYLNIAAIEGPLTLGLHCSELVVNVFRDESQWRCATGRNGAKMSRNPLAAVFGSPLNVGLLVAKPVLHWMLGLAIHLVARTDGRSLMAIPVSMFPVQIMNFTAALAIFSLVITIVALYSPKGPQPAAYGHIQTLANLIDKWSPVMWWGEKPGGLHRHAGTSDTPLPLVDMNVLYA